MVYIPGISPGIVQYTVPRVFMCCSLDTSDYHDSYDFCLFPAYFGYITTNVWNLKRQI